MDFADFYQTTSPRTLRYAYGLTGDLPLAQDITQEAYARAWQRWRTVSAYHDIEAWLRVVVTRLVYDWWRRLGVRRAQADRAEYAKGPSEETVLRTTALKQLPQAQARALALHYLLDLPISQIARETGVAEGTVKSWLSRGRAGLADLLREEASTAKLAPAQDVQDRGRRRRRTQMIVAMVIGLALIAGLSVWGRHQSHPQPVTPSPSPAPVRGLQRVGVIPDGLPPKYSFSLRYQYASRDVLLLEGEPSAEDRGIVGDYVIALDRDGRQLWQRSRPATALDTQLPFRDVLVFADSRSGVVEGWNWQGDVVWQRAPQKLDAVVPMRHASDQQIEAAAFRRPTETGLLLLTADGTLSEVSTTDGSTTRTWKGVPTGSMWNGVPTGRTYYAYEGKFYAGGDQLTTIDLGGTGPDASYTAPPGRVVKDPAVCFRTAVCFTEEVVCISNCTKSDTSLVVVRDQHTVMRHEGGAFFGPTAAADAVYTYTGPGQWWLAVGDQMRQTSVDGEVLWIDDANVIVSNRSTATIGTIDPVSGNHRELGRIASHPLDVASDGRFLVVTTKQEITVYRLTQ
jgi:RNA polymerase sigma factor (sigma-70 family)